MSARKVGELMAVGETPWYVFYGWPSGAKLRACYVKVLEVQYSGVVDTEIKETIRAMPPRYSWVTNAYRNPIPPESGWERSMLGKPGPRDRFYIECAETWPGAMKATIIEEQLNP